MNKSKDQKTKKPRTWNEAIVEASNTYDGTNYIYDGLDDTINTEQDMIKKYSKSQEEVKNQPFVKNKKPIAPRRERSKTQRDTRGQELKINVTPYSMLMASNVEDAKFPKIEKEILSLLDDDKTLERLEEARNKPSPEFFRGLGTFFGKKF